MLPVFGAKLHIHLSSQRAKTEAMKLELQSASTFIVDFMRKSSHSTFTAKQLALFQASLIEVLRRRYRDHWYPEKPFKGSGYRCIRINARMDPLIAQAGENCGLDPQLIHNTFPTELTIWIDPLEVTYRIGENGSICTLYEYQEDSKNQPQQEPHQLQPQYQPQQEPHQLHPQYQLQPQYQPQQEPHQFHLQYQPQPQYQLQPLYPPQPQSQYQPQLQLTPQLHSRPRPSNFFRKIFNLMTLRPSENLYRPLIHSSNEGYNYWVPPPRRSAWIRPVKVERDRSDIMPLLPPPDYITHESQFMDAINEESYDAEAYDHIIKQEWPQDEMDRIYDIISSIH